MKTPIKTFILCLFLLSYSVLAFGQESKKNLDSLETKKIAKSNFNSRQSTTLNTKKSKVLTKKSRVLTKKKATSTRKDYVIKKDSVHSKKHIQTNKFSNRKGVIKNNDSLSRNHIINTSKTQKKKTLKKTDSLRKKQIIKTQ